MPVLYLVGTPIGNLEDITLRALRVLKDVALVRAALEGGFRVEVVPGPSAVTAALALSGLPSDQFVFLGFLPRAAGQRHRLLSSLLREPRTMVALEAPHRLIASLEEMASLFGDRPMAVCREMTKLHEEVFRGSPPARQRSTSSNPGASSPWSSPAARASMSRSPRRRSPHGSGSSSKRGSGAKRP